MSEMILQRVSLLVSDKAPRPQTLFEMFPQVFSDEELKEIKEKEKQAQLETYKAKFKDFALRHNARKGDKQ